MSLCDFNNQEDMTVGKNTLLGLTGVKLSVRLWEGIKHNGFKADPTMHKNKKKTLRGKLAEGVGGMNGVNEVS